MTAHTLERTTSHHVASTAGTAAGDLVDLLAEVNSTPLQIDLDRLHSEMAYLNDEDRGQLPDWYTLRQLTPESDAEVTRNGVNRRTYALQVAYTLTEDLITADRPIEILASYRSCLLLPEGWNILVDVRADGWQALADLTGDPLLNEVCRAVRFSVAPSKSRHTVYGYPTQLAAHFPTCNGLAVEQALRRRFIAKTGIAPGKVVSDRVLDAAAEVFPTLFSCGVDVDDVQSLVRERTVTALARAYEDVKAVGGWALAVLNSGELLVSFVEEDVEAADAFIAHVAGYADGGLRLFGPL